MQFSEILLVHMLTEAVSPCAQESKHEDKTEKEEQGVKYHRVERSSSFVKRSIRMPDSADLSQIKVRALHSQDLQDCAVPLTLSVEGGACFCSSWQSPHFVLHGLRMTLWHCSSRSVHAGPKLHASFDASDNYMLRFQRRLQANSEFRAGGVQGRHPATDNSQEGEGSWAKPPDRH